MSLYKALSSAGRGVRYCWGRYPPLPVAGSLIFGGSATGVDVRVGVAEDVAVDEGSFGGRLGGRTDGGFTVLVAVGGIEVAVGVAVGGTGVLVGRTVGVDVSAGHVPMKSSPMYPFVFVWFCR